MVVAQSFCPGPWSACSGPVVVRRVGPVGRWGPLGYSEQWCTLTAVVGQVSLKQAVQWSGEAGQGQVWSDVACDGPRMGMQRSQG